jgi:hypothetical protein
VTFLLPAPASLHTRNAICSLHDQGWRLGCT